MGGAHIDDGTRIDDDGPVRHMAHCREIAGHEQEGHAGLFLHLAQEAHGLHLRRHPSAGTGSSQIIRAGSMASAQAMPMRWGAPDKPALAHNLRDGEPGVNRPVRALKHHLDLATQ